MQCAVIVRRSHTHLPSCHAYHLIKKRTNLRGHLSLSNGALAEPAFDQGGHVPTHPQILLKKHYLLPTLPQILLKKYYLLYAHQERQVWYSTEWKDKDEKGKKEIPLGRESKLKQNNKKKNSRRLTFKEEGLQAYSSCGSHSPTWSTLYKFWI